MAYTVLIAMRGLLLRALQSMVHIGRFYDCSL
jgi:hypothetical protein